MGALLEITVVVLPRLDALQTTMGAMVPEPETVSKIHDAAMPAAETFSQRCGVPKLEALCAHNPLVAMLLWH